MPTEPDPRTWEEITEDEDVTKDVAVRSCPDCYG